MSVEQKIEELIRIRERIKSLRIREQRLIREIHTHMTQDQTNRIDTGEVLCQRSVVNRTVMTKANVPPEIWDEYAVPIEYVRLLVKYTQ